MKYIYILLICLILFYIITKFFKKYIYQENFDPSLVPVSSIITLAKVAQKIVDGNGTLTSPANLNIGTPSITGNLLITNSTTTNGNMVTNGTFTVNNSANSGHTLDVTGDANITGNTNIGGILNISGSTIIGTPTNTPTSTLINTLTSTPTNTPISTPTSSLIVNGNTTINGNAILGGQNIFQNDVWHSTTNNSQILKFNSNSDTIFVSENGWYFDSPTFNAAYFSGNGGLGAGSLLANSGTINGTLTVNQFCGLYNPYNPSGCLDEFAFQQFISWLNI